MRIFSRKYPGFAAMWQKLVLMYEKGPWRQKSGKYPDIFHSKALNVRPQDSCCPGGAGGGEGVAQFRQL